MAAQTSRRHPPSHRPLDLIIVPNRGLIIAGEHLSDADAKCAVTDWRHMADNLAAHASDRWQVAVAFVDGDIARVEQTLMVPRVAGGSTESVA